MEPVISVFDWVVIGLYFTIVFTIALWPNIKRLFWKDQQLAIETSADYFLAGRHIGWFVIGASLFASNIGSEHLVGLAGGGARGDFASAQFELLASLILILLGWVFVPFYLKSGVFTMPEFLEKRYSPAARTYLSLISILAYVLTKISVTIFAGALVFEVLLGVPFWTGATLVVIATGIYTVLGGLRAVVYTDMMQMFVLVFGAIAVTYFSLEAIGGWSEVTAIIAENNTSEDATKFLSLWREHSDPDYPWTGILFGAPILGIWYWCTDQFIVQRVLSAKDMSNARRGTLFAGFLKILPLFLFVIPGVIAYALSVKDPTLMQDASGVVEYDKALPALVTNFLPTGFKGLVVAGLLAALMSSLSSVFNSCSTLFTIDFYKRYRPDVSEKQLIRVGQLATVILVVIGLAWIPLMKSMTEGGGIYKYLQSIQAYISPPIAAVFLFGLFNRRINALGAMASLWTGFALGMLRLVLEYLTSGYQDGTAIINIAPNGLIAWFASVSFLHYAIFLFVICSIVLVLASRWGRMQSDEELENVIFRREPGSHLAGLLRNRDFWWTVLLIIAVLLIWFIFSPLGIA